MVMTSSDLGVTCQALLDTVSHCNLFKLYLAVHGLESSVDVLIFNYLFKLWCLNTRSKAWIVHISVVIAP